MLLRDWFSCCCSQLPPKTKEGPCFGSSKWLLEARDGGPSSPTATSTPCSLHESQAGEPHLHPGFASLAPHHPTPLERQPWRAPGKASVTELVLGPALWKRLSCSSSYFTLGREGRSGQESLLISWMISCCSFAPIPKQSSTETLWEARGPVLWSRDAADLSPGHGNQGLHSFLHCGRCRTAAMRGECREDAQTQQLIAHRRPKSPKWDSTGNTAEKRDFKHCHATVSPVPSSQYVSSHP